MQTQFVVRLAHLSTLTVAPSAVPKKHLDTCRGPNTGGRRHGGSHSIKVGFQLRNKAQPLEDQFLSPIRTTLDAGMFILMRQESPFDDVREV